MTEGKNVDSSDRSDEEPTPVRTLRLWPAFAIILLQTVIMFGPQVVAQSAMTTNLGNSNAEVEQTALDNPQTILNSKLLGPAVGTLLLTLWWLAVSRAPWIFRLVVPFILVGIAWLTWQAIHPTMVFAFFMFVIPCAWTVGVLGLYVFQRLPLTQRGLITMVLVVATFAIWAQFRMEGVDGDLNSEFAFRWAMTDEQRFLAENASVDATFSLTIESLKAEDGDSPEFRGRNRDGVIRGESIRSDWPEEGLPEVWRQRIGPGWSSFAVVDDWIFTQEQRGDDEVVSAYGSTNGEARWVQKTKSRFTESISGVGPRATPTFANGKLYTTGASGDVQCLEATTGEVLWRRDLSKDTGAYLPMWGFSSSPLVVEDRVIIFAGGGTNKAIIAYDATNGEVLWQTGNGYLSYSSPQLETLHDIPQVLMMTEEGLASFDPESGKQLWNHKWKLGGGSARIIQPKVLDNDIIIGTGYGLGTRRISVEYMNNKWSTLERWTSLALKPYFNDFVIFGEHIYGFDKNIFTCVELETGHRVWKRGRYGHGQVILIEDSGHMLVLSEKGDLILLRANHENLEELHRFKAVNGKTWNHPVIANGKLFVRNGVEAACFDISPTSRSN